MKVLFYLYASAFQSPGGGEIMLLKTKEALEKANVTVKLFNQWEDKLADYDILHVFGSVKECLPLMQKAKQAGIKVALSPIYWSTMQRSLHEYGSFRHTVIMVARHTLKVLVPAFPSDRRKMMQIADIVIPNSRAEADIVSRLFAISENKMHVAYLGADEKFLKPDPVLFKQRYKLDEYILSVGRIEPRKNQLNLIKAMKGTGKKIVFIGDTVTGYETYFNTCKSEAGNDALFIKRLDHEDGLLASAYAGCKVFVLQGWFETPGLVALEAGLAGASLAVTVAGSTKEYFQDFVEYFKPESKLSIKKAIFQALHRDKNELLRSHIQNNFLWKHAAEQTIAAYKRILA